MLPGRKPDQPDQPHQPAGRTGLARRPPADRRLALSERREPAGEYLHCPQCASERSFERPECLDGHGADCPERACVHCGTAILVAPLTQPGAGHDDGAHPSQSRVVRQPAVPGQAPDASSRGRAARSLTGPRRSPRSLA